MKLPHWPIPYGKKIIDLELTRIRKLLHNLGNPHLKMPPIIHVAGTNGKGSTIAYLKSIFEAAGYKVHQYTSPHLVRFNERITIAGQEIEDDILTGLIEECRIMAGDLELTFFEGTTAAAFLAFSRFQADIVLLETGLGGRLDATNVIENSILSIITPISLDHVEYLGDNVIDIAKEKAGIIKNNSRCVTSWQEKSVRDVFKEECKNKNTAIYACGEDWSFANNNDSFLFKSDDYNIKFPLPSLQGMHQIINAATAVASITQIENFDIKKDHIDLGLTSAVWPARLQHINSGVLFSKVYNANKESELWLDGAHNISGAEMLIASIQQMTKKLPLYLINGRSKDRDIEGFLKYFMNKVEFLCATHIKSEPLSENSENIYNIAHHMGFYADLSDSVSEAIDKCLKHASGKRIRILICGSLYLLGDVLAVNQEQ